MSYGSGTYGSGTFGGGTVFAPVVEPPPESGVPLWIDEKTLRPVWLSERTFNMIGVKEDINNLVVGDTWAFRRTYEGLPPGATVSKAWLTIKRDHSQTDNAAGVIQIPITTTETADGQIEDATTASDGKITVYLVVSKTLTAGLQWWTRYYYDIQVLLSTGEIHTCQRGEMRTVPGSTAASS